MFRRMLALLFVVTVSRPAWSAPPTDEVSETLERAEALYYQADFAKSIELLLRVDELLRSQQDHLQDKINVKLQLALAYVGLNDNTQAKRYFGELYALDSDHPIDPQMFSPKIIQLADQARTEQDELRCRTSLTDAERQLGIGNAEGVRQLITTRQAKCSALAALAPRTADLFLKGGLEAYKKAQMVDALHMFRSAVQLNPKLELASQYIDLTQDKLQLDADRVLIAWRKDFAAGEFGGAAKDYRQLLAVSSTETMNDVRSEYRKALTALVEAWNRACAASDAPKMEEIRQRVNELLPDLSIGEDILSKMTSCTPTGCVQMNSAIALARLKSRVDPEFPAFVRSQVKGSVTVRVKTRINEKGEVISSEAVSGNPILFNGVRAAVDRWKFIPTLLQGEPRCVDSEIPIVITFTAN
jgi:tetratricopeptide (TPR) repeat protein